MKQTQLIWSKKWHWKWKADRWEDKSNDYTSYYLGFLTVCRTTPLTKRGRQQR